MKDKDFNKFHDEVLDKCVKLSDHLIETGLKDLKWQLTNGFNVTFHDRKRKRK